MQGTCEVSVREEVGSAGANWSPCRRYARHEGRDGTTEQAREVVTSVEGREGRKARAKGREGVVARRRGSSEAQRAKYNRKRVEHHCGEKRCPTRSS